jgi:hypothetical protein
VDELQKARERLAQLNEAWPWDGWDGAAEARAAHHRLVIEQEALVKRLELAATTGGTE